MPPRCSARLTRLGVLRDYAVRTDPSLSDPTVLGSGKVAFVSDSANPTARTAIVTVSFIGQP
jgi:hypothetical protein